jgi:hypothetical protein
MGVGKLLKGIVVLSLIVLNLHSAQAVVEKGGKTDKGEDGIYYNWDDEEAVWGLQFDASTDFVLKSVKVYSK